MSCNLAEEARKFSADKRIDQNKLTFSDNARLALTTLQDDIRKYLRGEAPLHAECMLKTVQAGLA